MVTSLVLTVWDVLYYLSIAELHLLYLHHSAGLIKQGEFNQSQTVQARGNGYM